MAADENLPPPEQLQFRRAQHEFDPNARVCIMCKQEIAGEFFQANGNNLCGPCAETLRLRHQAPPVSSLLPAVLYGGAAALGGLIIYATVAVVFHLELALIAILIGWMVGKAIRHASHGLGGRPQQILAVALTYFAITGSYLAVGIVEAARQPRPKEPQVQSAPPSVPKLVGVLAMILVAAPFLSLFQGSNHVSSLISFVIIFFGLRQAWMLTKRPEIIITGPLSPN